MTNLSVNVNKIAWLRNARGGNTPDIIELSELIIDCGVSSITVHPRPDLRHITPDDVYKLRELTISKDVEFNIEGNPLEGESKQYIGFMEIIRKHKPTQTTLVPDSTSQITSDHGWEITEVNNLDLTNQVRANSKRCSIFVDADLDLDSLTNLSLIHI